MWMFQSAHRLLTSTSKYSDPFDDNVLFVFVLLDLSILQNKFNMGLPQTYLERVFSPLPKLLRILYAKLPAAEPSSIFLCPFYTFKDLDYDPGQLEEGTCILTRLLTAPLWLAKAAAQGWVRFPNLQSRPSTFQAQGETPSVLTSGTTRWCCRKTFFPRRLWILENFIDFYLLQCGSSSHEKADSVQ